MWAHVFAFVANNACFPDWFISRCINGIANNFPTFNDGFLCFKRCPYIVDSMPVCRHTPFIYTIFCSHSVSLTPAMCISFPYPSSSYTNSFAPKSDTDFETIFATISTTMAVRCIVPSKNMLTLLIIYPRSFYCSLLSTCHAICTQRYMLRFSRIV